MLKIISKNRIPTKWALALKSALEKEGIIVYKELDDGYKTIDLAIPRARLNIEVDGIQHLTNPHQIIADLDRGFYSHLNGYDTMHISNEMINHHLPEIAKALAHASKVRERNFRIHVE